MNDTETFQHYQVLRREDGSLWELGRGAMGVTYKAFDVNLRCHVALKVINAQYLESEMARARFLREARAAAGLRHRNVASVYHLGNDAESFFYSMEYIDGQTVEDLVQSRGPLPAYDALQIARQVARALGAAAKQGVVHRDIKPANLMVVYEDEGDDEGFVVKVIDFGLARSAVAAGDNSGAITMGGFVGTPQYASPEQIEENDLDVRSDIYSLGITLWYMLVGQPPFTGTVFRISSQHLTKEPPWADIEASVPEPVRALLARMLQKDPAARPQTPTKLRAEIEDCLRQLPSAQPSQLVLGVPSVPVDDTRIPEDHDASSTVVEGPAPTEGRLFAGRYQLGALVGEGASGQIFRAYDGRLDGKLVAVKVLHPDLNLSAQAFYHLQGDLARLRDAPHPHLIETFGLERVQGYKYSVMEWINGYPLQGLLRSKGALGLRDALRLLGQAADAAAHCSAHRLYRLELSPQKILLHFPTLDEHAEAPSPASLVARDLDGGPRFSLKIDALAPAREAGRSSARRSGGASPRVTERDTLTSIRGLVEGSYFHALGTLLYELLGATPPPPDKPQDSTPVDALGTGGNALLRRALSTNPGFGNELEFFQALLGACDVRAADLGWLPSSAGGTASTPSTARESVRPSSAEAVTYAPLTARPAEARGPQTPAPLGKQTIVPTRESSAPVVKPPPAPVHEPAEGERTVACDEAATLVQPQRISPFPPPAQARAPLVPLPQPPPVTPPTPPPAAPPEVAPPVEPVPQSWQEVNPSEAATFAPVEPSVLTPPKVAPSAPVAIVPPVTEAAVPPEPEVAAPPVAMVLPAAEVTPAPAVAAPRPPARSFPPGPALAIAAALVVVGLVATLTVFKSRPSNRITGKTSTPPPANVTPATVSTPTPGVVRAQVTSAPPPVVPSPPTVAPVLEKPVTEIRALVVDNPPVPPTATPADQTPAVLEAVPTPLPGDVTPRPELSEPPARPVATPSPPPKFTPAPTAHRDNKTAGTLPTPKPNRVTPPPVKANPREKPVQKAKPTPAKGARPTPRGNDDTPDFLR